MKKRTKIIIALAVACAGTLVLGACKTDDNPYRQHKDTVSVCFDVNGGSYSIEAVHNLVDLIPIEQAQKGVRLLAPDDSLRGNDGLTVSRSGYFLAGWYSERNLRTDESGNALDEDGNLCSESGKEQGYIYGGRWDFDTDRYQQDETTDYVRGEYDFTLYAAWVPNYTYRLFAETEPGDWEVVATYSYDPSVSDDSVIPIPVWNEETGALDYGKFPNPTSYTNDGLGIDGLTFEAVYADQSKSEALESITHEGTWDPETGVAIGGVKDYYGEFLSGVWYHIETAQQLVQNVRGNGCYDIRADLDFGENLVWPNAFATGTFSGTFQGNGHTVSGITVNQSSAENRRAGMFGNVTAKAVFKDIHFENITFNLNSGSRYADAQFGLFAGNLAAGATFEGVTLSGTFHIGADVAAQSTYHYEVGILSGNGNSGGLSWESIELTYDAGIEADMNDHGEITITKVRINSEK